VLGVLALVSRLYLLFFVPLGVFAQNQADEDFHVYTDSPRLLLTHQRLRLLQRERERESVRWQQFDALISGGAPMPEPGFAWALYSQVSKNPAFCRKAIDWAMGSEPRYLPQDAVVLDWCSDVMTRTEADRLAGAIRVGSEARYAPAAEDFRGHSARVLAVIAMADHLGDHGASALRDEIEGWWRGYVVPRIKAGHAIPRDQMYWVYEMFHAVRDNLKIDLRESAPAYFHSLPVDHLSSHYPAPYQASENEYRVPVYVRDGEPDLKDAAMSRAAEMAMVAYDDNALESQYLQGWLMQDRFLMRGALGAVYEFLWANPYQPGLSYFHTPLIFHDAQTGHVFARTSWDEDATWVGYFDGHLQMFRDGHVETLREGVATKPVRIGDALLLSAERRDAARFHADAEAVFVLNLDPHAVYDVEVDDQELWECETDAGGTLVLSFPEGTDAGVRIRRRN
jgi:hypothetical protein